MLDDTLRSRPQYMKGIIHRLFLYPLVTREEKDVLNHESSIESMTPEVVLHSLMIRKESTVIFSA